MTLTFVSPACQRCRVSTVEDTCIAAWDDHGADCSGFVKAVCARLGVPMTAGQADAIVDYIKAVPSGFYPLPSGVAAAAAAQAGELVIGALRSNEHEPSRNNGHVVIVTGEPLAHDLYPTAYWGTLGGVGRKATTTNYAWREGDRDRVRYFGHRL